MAVNGDEKSLVELKGTGELLGELPHAFQQLIDDGRRLLWVTDQVVASVGRRGQQGEQEERGMLCVNQSYHDPSKRLGDRPVRELVSKGDPVFLYKNLSMEKI